MTKKIKTGVVLSNKMEKTVVVRVDRTYCHPRLGKAMRRWRKYYVHAENAQALVPGEKVTIVETRPLSKTKRWRVVSESAVSS